jgi:hypothetical protein
MPIEITMVKTLDGSFRPATAADQALVVKMKPGQGVRFKAARVSQRALKHQQLYWAGLLGLAMDYWEPKGGLIAPSEKSTLLRFAGWLDKKGGDTGAIRRAAKAFLTELRDSRAGRIETPEKSIEALHSWVKIEAGWYHLEMTPSGIRKAPKSINFNAMDQEEFEQFYKAAFSVIWRFILSRTFATEREAQNAIDQLLAMG